MAADTLKTLQKPTMSLIESFYQMPNDVYAVFITMLALYEQTPTPENAAFLFDKIMGKDTPKEKKEWFLQQEKNLSLVRRTQVEDKYIVRQHPVPKGLPTSGNLLVGLGVVSRADKDLLMEAQAAARILEHLENPAHVNLTQELFEKNEDGQISEARSYLDKPFSTQIQRLEHLCAIMAGYQVVQKPYAKINAVAGSGFGLCVPDINPAINEFHKAAISTLYQVAQKLSPQSEHVTKEIRALATNCAPEDEVQGWQLKPIVDTMNAILPCLFNWHAPHLDRAKHTPCEDSYTPDERVVVENLIAKRLRQIQSAPIQARLKTADIQK